MRNNMEITNENRSALMAAKDIIQRGLETYVNDGIRFGYFSEEDNPKEIGNNVLKKLEDLELYEFAQKLKEVI